MLRITRLALVLLATPGCLGRISAQGRPNGNPPPNNMVVEQPSPTVRYARLSHTQWENTVTALLRFDSAPGLASSFLHDATSGTFENTASELRVGSVLWEAYRDAAETVADRVTADTALMARIVPPDTGDAAARARTFVTQFGTRAFRRPITDAEVTSYVALFDRGLEFFPDARAFDAGVKIVIQAMLQSPHFLYRIESSSQQTDGVIPLTSYEIASRLSYALWDTMPDDVLFDAAQSNQLTDLANVRTQVTRMLADPRAHGMVTTFHDQLLELERVLDANHDPTTFPEFTNGSRPSLVAETENFVQHVVFGAHSGLTTLLTAPYTFADQNVANIYGLTGSFDTTFRQTNLDPMRRAGLLTQPSFLAVNSTYTETDPIHRGVFVNRRILCAQLPAPPNNVPPLPPAMGMVTMRERITAHTGAGTCGASCHGTMINPVGFAFEHYDAIGRWRELDNNLPVNAADSYFFPGATAPRSYDGAVQFAQVIATEAMTHRCYVRHWLEFMHGRAITQDDQPIIERIAGDSMEHDLPVLDLITELVTTRAFRTRAVTEVAP